MANLVFSPKFQALLQLPPESFYPALFHPRHDDYWQARRRAQDMVEMRQTSILRSAHRKKAYSTKRYIGSPPSAKPTMDYLDVMQKTMGIFVVQNSRYITAARASEIILAVLEGESDKLILGGDNPRNAASVFRNEMLVIRSVEATMRSHQVTGSRASVQYDAYATTSSQMAGGREGDQLFRCEYDRQVALLQAGKLPAYEAGSIEYWMSGALQGITPAAALHITAKATADEMADWEEVRRNRDNSDGEDERDAKSEDYGSEYASRKAMAELDAQITQYRQEAAARVASRQKTY